MAVATQNAISGPYTANGATVTFPFTFTAPSTSEVGVLLRDDDGNETTVSSGDYSVTLSSRGGGAVTFDTAPASGDVYIILDPLFTQDIEFENGSAWVAEVVNAGYDRAAARDQYLKARVEKVSPAGLLTGGGSGKFLAWDADGNPIASEGTGADAGLRTDLAADSGASLMRFLQSGTSAVARTIQDKLRERGVSVKDFGAKGDDIADDTAAIEAAFTQGGAIYFPAGTYRYAPTAATGFLSDTVIYGDGPASVIKYAPLASPVTSDIQQVLRPRAYANVENIVIRDITIDGNRDGVDWSGITGDGGAFGVGLWGTQNVFMDNITVQNCWTDGYFLAYTHSSMGTRRQCQNIRFGTLHAYNCGRQGMSIISAEDVVGGTLHVDTVDRTAPRAALDLEPNLTTPDKIKNIHIGQITGSSVGSGVLIAGVSTIENISIGSVILDDVTSEIGLQIKKATNVQIGSCQIVMGNGTQYSFYATDYANVHIGSLIVNQKSGVSSGDAGGVLLDTLPTGADFTNSNLRIDHLYLNGARGNGFRHNAGQASIGYAEIKGVNQNGAGVAFFLGATCTIDYAVANDGSGRYAVQFSADGNRILSGDLADGTLSGISLGGHAIDWGSTRLNGQPYQNNFYRGAGTPEGVVTANVGALYFNSNGGSATTLYVKQSGTGNTGWVGK